MVFWERLWPPHVAGERLLVLVSARSDVWHIFAGSVRCVGRSCASGEGAYMRRVWRNVFSNSSTAGGGGVSPQTDAAVYAEPDEEIRNDRCISRKPLV